MKSSTGLPAFTISITRRGRFSRAIIASSEWAPITRLPRAGPAMNSSTLDTVRL